VNLNTRVPLPATMTGQYATHPWWYFMSCELGAVSGMGAAERFRRSTRAYDDGPESLTRFASWRVSTQYGPCGVVWAYTTL